MKTEKIQKPEKKEWFTTREVLWYMVFIGFGINYMIRINLNIAIVSMVKFRPRNNLTQISECLELSEEPTSPIMVDEGVFDWDEREQGVILGAFYYFHWISQIPGGIYAQKYGTKAVFGLSNLLGVLLCFLIPQASYMGYSWLVFLRVVQGFITGLSWPAMHHMTARWIPPNERSKFITAYLGSSIGAALTFMICGHIMARWGWEPVFHVCGLIGCVWYAGWYFLVYDSPAEHPRITEEEKDYITHSLGRSISREMRPTPWLAILTSLPVWLNVFTQWGGIWGLFTSMTHAPTYFKVVHGWNIRATGFLSGLPHFLRVIWAYFFSMFGDYMLRSNKMSRTNVRKLATFFSCIMHGLCMVAMAYSGCNYTGAIVFLAMAAMFHGAVSTGSLAAFVDLSPNYASIQLGLSGMISVLPGFISPAIVGFLTFNNQTIGQWQIVFWIAAFMLITPGILHIMFAKSELQEWNDPKSAVDVVLEAEMSKLKLHEDVEEQEAEATKNGENHKI